AIDTYQPSLTTSVYDRHEELIAEFFVEKRHLVSLQDVPLHVRLATIAAEDSRFYRHGGVDVLGILRALWTNVRSGATREGASTITQQTARALFLTQERTLRRKLGEMILARRIEQRYSKDRILALYLNQTFYGHHAYGIEAAAQLYFGKSATALTLGEGALLTGLIPAPNAYSPLKLPAVSVQRRTHVLRRMVAEGYLDQADAERVAQEPLGVVTTGPGAPVNQAPYFVEQVRQYIEATYGADALYRGGLTVHTTLDLRLQQAAVQALQQGLRALENRHRRRRRQQSVPTPAPGVQGALVALEVGSGHVLAMVGGYDFASSQFNRAVQARRQPGSAFKPLIYAAALDAGMTPDTLVEDRPLRWLSLAGEAWQPANHDNRFWGPITLRTALTHSRNVATVSLLARLELEPTCAFAKQLGIDSPLRCVPSIALGTSNVSLLELTSAYGVFAQNGEHIRPRFIRQVVDRERQVLEEHQPQPRPVMRQRDAHTMTNLLESVVRSGTGRVVRAVGRPAAGKTGTTNGFRDAWFIGYTPELVTGVWVGRDDHTPLGDGEHGRRAAGPIWLSFMQVALRGQPVRSFPLPPAPPVPAPSDLVTDTSPPPHRDATHPGSWITRFLQRFRR
ncbi:MAG: PBP1A family penicillin-binding protein, partial [Candidatus Tectomicrobia bacterium]